MRINRLRRARGGDKLTPAQEMNLLIGAPGGFRNDAERRAAWFQHRDELLASVPNGRPWAWILFEAGGFRPEEGNRITVALERIEREAKCSQRNV